MNKRSIGIELVNLGDKCGDDKNKVLCNFGKGETCKSICENKGLGVENGGVVWEVYPQEQIDSLAQLIAEIGARNDILIDREHVIGHNEVPNSKKLDPGPLFSWNEMLQKANSVDVTNAANSETGRGFYVLDKDGNSYVVDIFILIGKEEKNEA